MIIRYRGIDEEVLSDAPFVGARILAPDCSNNCPGCANQYLKKMEVMYDTPQDIINQVQMNSFHQGIILGGLEWTETPRAMRELVRIALCRSLKVIIYTHLTKDEFCDQFPDLLGLPIWAKFGEYRKGAKSHKSKGILLASDNQYIEWLGC